MLAQQQETMAQKLESIKAKVACPIGAMRIEDSEIVCICPLTNFKRVEKVSLGNIEKDILNNCNGCKLKLKKSEDQYLDLIKLQGINEYQEVQCPAEDNKNVSAAETCISCAFFNVHKMKELMEDDKKDEPEFIPCNFPNLPKENLKVFIEKKVAKKKAAPSTEKLVEF